MNIFFNETPIVLNTVLAKLIGLNGALVLQQIHYWVEINRKAKKNLREGYYWTYNTYEDWKKNNFDFWCTRTIIRIIQDLEKSGFLISDNFNKKGYDRTKWYRINYDKLNLLYEKTNTIETTENSHVDKLSQSANINTTDHNTTKDIEKHQNLKNVENNHVDKLSQSVNISITEDNIIKTSESLENTHVDKLSSPCTEFVKSTLTSCQVHVPNLSTPIPETKTETNDIDLTTTTTTSGSPDVTEEVVVVNNQAHINFNKKIETIENILKQNEIILTQEQIGKLLSDASNTTYDNKFNNKTELISDKLKQHNIKFSQKQIESLLKIANNNTEIIIKYINYMLSKIHKIDNQYGYLKSLILKPINLKQNKNINTETEQLEDELLKEQIEIINKKLKENNITLERKQIKDLLELAHHNTQVVITYIDYMLKKPIKIESVYAYLRSAISDNWDTTISNYEGKAKDKNPNKIVNYTGRTWDFEKIKELEQQYLEDTVKDFDAYESLRQIREREIEEGI